MKRFIAILLAGGILASGTFSDLTVCQVDAAEISEDLISQAEQSLGEALADPGLPENLKGLLKDLLAAFMEEAAPEDAAGDTDKAQEEQQGEASREEGKDSFPDTLPTEWDLTELYADEDAFNADMDYFMEHLDAVEKYRGTLDNADSVLAFTEDEELLKLDSIYYKSLMYSEFLLSLDASDPWAKQVQARVSDADAKYMMASAFIEPELMALPLEEREKIFSDESLADYAYYYHDYVKPDKVTLSEETKQAETLLNQAADQAQNAYLVFDNVDNKRPEITYPDGTTGTLTDEAYSLIVKNPEYDHAFRKEAHMLRASFRKPYENTYVELLAGEMKRNWAEAQLYGYDSTLAYIADKEDLDPELFYNIIDFAHSLWPKLHEYFAKRKELLGFSEAGSYDLALSFNDFNPPEMSYEDCVKLGREAIRFWGDEYLDCFERIITSNHIDVYPSDTKEGGAYEYLLGNETTPFVKFNFDGTMDYTSTIVHEMGHAVYSELSAENQNTYNCIPGSFNQEVASTANEVLLYKQLIENATDDEERQYWLMQEIDLFFNTLIWQCLIAEFEDYCYKTIEAGDALSAEAMNEKFYELIKGMYGDAILVEPYVGIDWARIPHLYNGYYVYKYATSLTFATAICNKAMEDESEKEAYIEYLKAGSSASPSDLLKIAGVDPSDPATYEDAKAHIEGLMDQFIAIK